MAPIALQRLKSAIDSACAAELLGMIGDALLNVLPHYFPLLRVECVELAVVEGHCWTTDWSVVNWNDWKSYSAA